MRISVVNSTVLADEAANIPDDEVILFGERLSDMFRKGRQKYNGGPILNTYKRNFYKVRTLASGEIRLQYNIFWDELIGDLSAFGNFIDDKYNEGEEEHYRSGAKGDFRSIYRDNLIKEVYDSTIRELFSQTLGSEGYDLKSYNYQFRPGSACPDYLMFYIS